MSTSTSITLEIPEDVREVIRKRMEHTGRDMSSVAGEMLTEAAKMERFPGIIFVDGPAGRRARVAGTGLEVFELIRGYRATERDWERFREGYHWLSEQQLRLALTYAAAYPGEIDAWLADDDDESGTLEAFWRTHPYARP